MIVEDNRQPGLLAYAEGDAVGWCSIASREEFSERINHSLFQKFNFIEVHRRHPKRPIMRYEMT